MTLSRRIVEYRAKEDISQAEFASRVGVDRGTISRAENGESVSCLTAVKIELVLRGRNNGEEEK